MSNLRLVRGHSASCRMCMYVMDPQFPLAVGDRTVFRPTCCRTAPPKTFEWSYTEIDPFCGQFERSEGDVSTDESKADIF